MNFLQIVQRTCVECGIAGGGPSTVVGQVREMGRVVGWCQAAYQEIQMEQPSDWFFLRKPFTFTTTAGKSTYSVDDIGLDDFAYWRNGSFRSYLQSSGVGTEILLSQYLDYSAFRDYYELGTRKLVTGRPMYISIAPDRSLKLGFSPDGVYVVSGEYYQTPQELTLDADVPLMPERYHMAIVYKAMMKYGLFEVANEQIEAGKAGYAQLINRLRCDQMPMLMTGDSLI